MTAVMNGVLVVMIGVIGVVIFEVLLKIAGHLERLVAIFEEDEDQGSSTKSDEKSGT